jgi:phosphinothricin acetyltransferase
MSTVLSGNVAVDESLLLRDSTDADVAVVQAIYAHHVLTGTGTFEESAPDVAEMARRRQSILAEGQPFLVAADKGDVLGFAYASRFRPRSAYRYTVEDSIYLDPRAIGRGLGRRLLAQLMDRCERLGYRQMVAVIGDSTNERSITLHARLGFRRSGTLETAGFKFGRWLDVVFMQRPLGHGGQTLPES